MKQFRGILTKFVLETYVTTDLSSIILNNDESVTLYPQNNLTPQIQTKPNTPITDCFKTNLTSTPQTA